VAEAPISFNPLPSPPPILFGPIVAVSVSENKFGGSVVVVDRPETAGSSE